VRPVGDLGAGGGILNPSSAVHPDLWPRFMIKRPDLPPTVFAPSGELESEAAEVGVGAAAFSQVGKVVAGEQDTSGQGVGGAAGDRFDQFGGWS
jgi:hypothetical protein